MLYRRCSGFFKGKKKTKTLIGAMLFHLNSFETNVNIIRIQILIFFSILLMLK